jgi:hypothetical protein
MDLASSSSVPDQSSHADADLMVQSNGSVGVAPAIAAEEQHANEAGAFPNGATGGSKVDDLQDCGAHPKVASVGVQRAAQYVPLSRHSNISKAEGPEYHSEATGFYSNYYYCVKIERSDAIHGHSVWYLNSGDVFKVSGRGVGVFLAVATSKGRTPHLLCKSENEQEPFPVEVMDLETFTGHTADRLTPEDVLHLLNSYSKLRAQRVAGKHVKSHGLNC